MTGAALAAELALGRSGARRALAAVVAAMLALPLLVVIAVIALIAEVAHDAAPEGIRSGVPIPGALAAVFNDAAAVWRVNPFLLASIAYQESSFGTGPSWQEINYAGCVGLMQMCVGGLGGDSWNQTVVLSPPAPASEVRARDAYRYGDRPERYAWPARQHPDILDSFDSVMAAAVHLRSKVDGRPIPDLDERAYRAACGYFGRCTSQGINYAPDVLARARAWQQSEESTAGVPAALGQPPDGRLLWPIAPTTPVTSPYCEARRWEPCHPGVDFAVAMGTAITAAGAGRISVLWRAPGGGYGNYLCIEHSASLSTCYAHLSRFAADVHLGARITGGQLLGYSGDTGRSFGPHLHFEVRLGPGYPAPTTCPAPYLGVGSAGMCARGT